MKVKPAEGLKVRDPVTRQLITDEGIEVPEFDLYWAARIRDGDVVPVTQTATKTKAADTK